MRIPRRALLRAAMLAGAAAIVGGLVWKGRREHARNRVLEERRAAVEAIPRLQTRGLVRRMGMDPFLHYWSDEVVKRLRSARFPPDAAQQRILATGSFLLAPAPAAEVERLRQRLGSALSPSFESFLAVTNGLPDIIGEAGDFKFFPCARIGWLHEHDPQLVEIWNKESAGDAPDDQYFRYGEHQDVIRMRPSYMRHAIALGPVVDGGVFLLNPQIRFDDGELEAWDFSVKYPGAIRYRSFAELLEAACADDCHNLEYWSLSHGWEAGRR